MSYLLDNFSSSERACFGSSWVAHDDQPMGGQSQVELLYQDQQSPASLRLKGHVKLLPAAGYIEAALPLIHSRHLFDASQFAGVYLSAQVSAQVSEQVSEQVSTQAESKSQQVEHFFVRLQTRELSMPWQYYQAAFSPGEQWQSFQIPFAQFQAINTSHALNPERLTRISVAAANLDFAVDLALREIGFYESQA